MEDIHLTSNDSPLHERRLYDQISIFTSGKRPVKTNRTLQIAEKGIYRLSRIFANISGAILALMMFLTVSDVILRYFFNRPILGAFELTEFMMVILVFCGLAYNQETQGNIAIDVVVNRLSEKRRRILSVITNLLGLGLFSLMTWRIFVYGLKIFAENQISRELRFPIFPVIFVTAFGSAILCLVLLLSLAGFSNKEAGK